MKPDRAPGDLRSGYPALRLYIELLPGKSEKRRSRFSVLDAPPIAQADERGLRVRLTSQQSKGLSEGDPVIYRGFTVGRVELGHFSAGDRRMEYQLFISAPYDALVTSNVRFWMNGGLRFEASAEGVKIENRLPGEHSAGRGEFRCPQGVGPGQAGKERPAVHPLAC